MTIKPERVDYEFVHREYGPLPSTATVAEQTHRYRLAQTAACYGCARKGSLARIMHHMTLFCTSGELTRAVVPSGGIGVGNS